MENKINYNDRANEMYERTMENVYSNVGKAKENIEKLSAFADELLPFLAEDIGDEMIELIEKAFSSICKIEEN